MQWLCPTPFSGTSVIIEGKGPTMLVFLHVVGALQLQGLLAQPL